MRNLFILALGLLALIVAQNAQAAEVAENEIALRLMGGFAFSSNLPASSGPVLGLEVEAEVVNSFAVGAIFSYAGFDAISPTPDANLAHFALNPKYVVHKGSARFSFGAIVGAQIASLHTASSGAIPASTSSTTSLALGVNANIDIPIWGVWNLSLSPSFIYGTSSKASQVGLMGGFGFRF